MSKFDGFISFITAALSENGTPSSSRIISAGLCVSSMALICWMTKHAMGLQPEAAMVWVGGLPAIIYALAAFTVSPYGIAKLGQTISNFSNKETPPASTGTDQPKG